MPIAAAAAAPSASCHPIPPGAVSWALERPVCAPESVVTAARRVGNGTGVTRGISMRYCAGVRTTGAPPPAAPRPALPPPALTSMDCGGMIQQAGLSTGQIGVGGGQPGVPGEQSAETDGTTAAAVTRIMDAISAPSSFMFPSLRIVDRPPPHSSRLSSPAHRRKRTHQSGPLLATAHPARIRNSEDATGELHSIVSRPN